MYLGASSCVLGSSAGDKLSIVVVDQVVVETHVFLLGEDGIVGLEPVCLEHRSISRYFISLCCHTRTSRIARSLPLALDI